MYYQCSLSQIFKEIFNLTQKNLDLTRENDMMKVRLQMHSNTNTDSTKLIATSRNQQFVSNELDQCSRIAEMAIQLEFYQKSNDELRIAKDVAEKDLQREKHKRILAQKERDAYSAAYEASLRHFEKWSSAKLKQVQPSSTNS